MHYLDQIEWVLGPYTAKASGRKIIDLQMKDGRWRPVSYPKFLAEVALGRELDPDDETVDHVDGDFTNNDWRNMRIINRSTHATDDNIRVELVELICVWCSSKFKRRPSKVSFAIMTDRAGPFCSNHCKGKYGGSLRSGCLPRPAQQYKQWVRYEKSRPIYYTVNKGGETIYDYAKRMDRILPTEDDIIAALPRRTPRKTKPKHDCPVCGQPTKNKRYCSVVCSGTAKANETAWPSNEDLQILVWRYPTRKIAKQLGISDSAIGKRCKKLGLSKPPRGYWDSKKSKTDVEEDPIILELIGPAGVEPDNSHL